MPRSPLSEINFSDDSIAPELQHLAAIATVARSLRHNDVTRSAAARMRSLAGRVYDEKSEETAAAFCLMHAFYSGDQWQKSIQSLSIGRGGGGRPVLKR
jgi:hypothetical protein